MANLPEIGGLYRCHFQTGDEMIVKVKSVTYDSDEMLTKVEAEVVSSDTPGWSPGEVVPFYSYSHWHEFKPERVYNVAPEPAQSSYLCSNPWVAYHPDFSGMCIFKTEIEALREAVKHGMAVKQVIYGKDIINDY